MIALRWAGLVALGVGAAAPVAGQPAPVTVAGAIRDSASGRPVAGVRIWLDLAHATWTGLDGRFTLDLPPGRYEPTLSCPRHDAPELVQSPPALVVGEPPDPVEWTLAGGAACLAPLGSARDAELRGILRVEGEVRILRLCGDTTLVLMVRFSPERWADLAKRVRRLDDDPGRPFLVVRLRGPLDGPGFFGPDRIIGYRLDVNEVLEARFRRPVDCSLSG